MDEQWQRWITHPPVISKQFARINIHATTHNHAPSSGSPAPGSRGPASAAARPCPHSAGGRSGCCRRCCSCSRPRRRSVVCVFFWGGGAAVIISAPDRFHPTTTGVSLCMCMGAHPPPPSRTPRSCTPATRPCSPPARSTTTTSRRPRRPAPGTAGRGLLRWCVG